MLHEEELILKVEELSDRFEEETLDLRHRMHQEPELAFSEVHTAEKILRELEGLGMKIRSGIAQTGIVADLEGFGPGKTLLLRADMDALPLKEQNDLPFKSQKDGVMHACGHDAHAANLVAVAKILASLKEEWKGRVRFVFQPAEEKGGGGREMIKEGILDDIPIDASMALHTLTTLKPGHFYLAHENVSSFSDRFVIKVKGKKAHSAHPETGVDAIALAGNIIVALNQILLKNIDPMERATYNIGKISGGTAPNIISDEVVLEGMMRNVKASTREVLRSKMEEISKGIARSLGGEAEFQFFEGYSGVYNDPGLTGFVEKNIRKYAKTWLRGIDETVEEPLVIQQNPMLGAEDYGFYTQRIPSCFYRVATGDHSPAHTSEFLIEEKYIKLLTRSMASLALLYLCGNE